MAILVIGRTGQLAQHLCSALPEAAFWGREDVDLSQPAVLERKARGAAPQVIVNAAAYTAVDRAESEPSTAWRVNAEAPAALARVAAELDIPLLHVSTDFVFSGEKSEPYVESDPVAPVNVYGASKLGGELAVRTIAPKHWILRTSWVFSEHGNNFVKTMLRLARERESLNVVADQRSRPTYAGDLARLIVALIEAPASLPYGIHHVGGGPIVSWFEFAREILGSAQRLGLVPQRPLHPIPTASYPTPARRPLNTVLEVAPAVDALSGWDWQRGLAHVLGKLA